MNGGYVSALFLITSASCGEKFVASASNNRQIGFLGGWIKLGDGFLVAEGETIYH